MEGQPIARHFNKEDEIGLQMCWKIVSAAYFRQLVISLDERFGNNFWENFLKICERLIFGPLVNIYKRGIFVHVLTKGSNGMIASQPSTTMFVFCSGLGLVPAHLTDNIEKVRGT